MMDKYYIYLQRFYKNILYNFSKTSIISKNTELQTISKSNYRMNYQEYLVYN